MDFLQKLSSGVLTLHQNAPGLRILNMLHPFMDPGKNWIFGVTYSLLGLFPAIRPPPQFF